MVVDDDDHVTGMISLSDILSYLALKPLGLERKDLVANPEKLLEESVNEEEEEEEDEEEEDESDKDEKGTEQNGEDMRTEKITKSESLPLPANGDYILEPPTEFAAPATATAVDSAGQ